MNDAHAADRARQLGVRSVPAVVIDGKIGDCCAGRGPREAILKAAGLGTTVNVIRINRNQKGLSLRRKDAKINLIT